MADSKKYDGSQWEHSLRKLTTATEAVENPLYSDGTAITAYTIKGNTVQDGTPTPSNPVPVVGVGELETTGEHSGEYKIPISSGGVTTNIYLGSVQTTRQIKKFVFTGSNDENWGIAGTTVGYRFNIPVPNVNEASQSNPKAMCSHLVLGMTSTTEGTFTISYAGSTTTKLLIKVDSTITSVALLKQWLADQYAAGTPLTLWAILDTATTGIVNEPLMKIGDYSDSISNAVSIPTTDGANSITVDTTVQPSEFTATWTGWHDSSVKEYDGTDWQ